RLMSRKKAMETFGVDEVINDLKASEVIIGKRSKKDIPEESKFAYKDIDTVINNELDLIEPIKKLKTIGVVKG
ncbi:RtcB family protein, partial [Vallitalea guaymasensis]